MAPSRLAPVPAVLLVTVLGSCGGGGPTGSTPTPRPQAFHVTGHWQGRLHQRGLRPFRITARIRSLRDARANTVSYTGIDCSGNWGYLGRRGAAFRFREVIHRGRGGTCKGVGTVTLTPAGADRLRYRFVGGGVESRGAISRAG